jgi:hypothetical protein
MAKRIIYVKTPKTAGTSVEEALRETIKPHIRIDGSTSRWPGQSELKNYRIIVLGDIVAREFRQQFSELWSESASFTIVRNPYDKLVSAWKYCKSTKDKSLQDALSRNLPQKSGKKYNHDYVHFSMRQKDFVVENESLIVDYLVGFESLQEDLTKFFGQHDINVPPLPHLNRTRSRDSGAPRFTPEVLTLIEERFGADFDFFDYPRWTSSSAPGGMIQNLYAKLKKIMW